MKDWRVVHKVRSKLFEESAFQLEENSLDFVVNEDVSQDIVVQLRDPTVDDVDENENTDKELVLSNDDDDDVDDDYVTQLIFCDLILNGF